MVKSLLSSSVHFPPRGNQYFQFLMYPPEIFCSHASKSIYILSLQFQTFREVERIVHTHRSDSAVINILPCSSVCMMDAYVYHFFLGFLAESFESGLLTLWLFTPKNFSTLLKVETVSYCDCNQEDAHECPNTIQYLVCSCLYSVRYPHMSYRCFLSKMIQSPLFMVACFMYFAFFP